MKTIKKGNKITEKRKSKSILFAPLLSYIDKFLPIRNYSASIFLKQYENYIIKQEDRIK